MAGTRSPQTPRRLTGQRATVQAALGEQDAFCSAQEIYGSLRAAGQRIGLATVYRHLKAFVDDGLVDAIHNPDGETVYRLCGAAGDAPHHHHLVCRRCGHAEEVEGRAVERWTGDIARLHGFIEVDHTVEVFGICPTCAASAPATDPV